MYLDELKHFMQCVHGNETPEQDIEDAMSVLEAALAPKESSENKTPVYLDTIS